MASYYGRPRFKFTFEVAADNAGPEDVIAMLQRVAEVVGKEAIQVHVPATSAFSIPSAPPAVPGGGSSLPVKSVRRSYRRLDIVEKKAILLDALRAEGWMLGKTAERLGISRETLRRWMQQLDIGEGEVP